MPLVLYPDDLSFLGNMFDDLCDQLTRSGAHFSREILARRLLTEASRRGSPPFEIASIVSDDRSGVTLH